MIDTNVHDSEVQSAFYIQKCGEYRRKLINWTLKVPLLWKNRPYLAHFCHSKPIPSLVQAFKPLPFVVSKLAKIGPYPS